MDDMMIAPINIKSEVRKMSQNEKKRVTAESILAQKKWSGARRPTGPATTALVYRQILSNHPPTLP